MPRPEKPAAPRHATQKPAAQQPATRKPAASQPEKHATKTREAQKRTARNVNVLKDKNVRTVEPASAIERWITLIRDGELDRNVRVKGKTGALLVRSS